MGHQMIQQYYTQQSSLIIPSQSYLSIGVIYVPLFNILGVDTRIKFSFIPQSGKKGFRQVRLQKAFSQIFFSGCNIGDLFLDSSPILFTCRLSMKFPIRAGEQLEGRLELRGRVPTLFEGRSYMYLVSEQLLPLFPNAM